MNRDRIYTNCLQGNVAAVIDYLKSCQDEEATTILTSYEKRFYGNEIHEIDSKDPWIMQEVGQSQRGSIMYIMKRNL